MQGFESNAKDLELYPKMHRKPILNARKTEWSNLSMYVCDVINNGDIIGTSWRHNARNVLLCDQQLPNSFISKNASCLTSIVDISPKPRPLYPPSDPPSIEPNPIFHVPLCLSFTFLSCYRLVSRSAVLVVEMRRRIYITGLKRIPLISSI